MINRHELLYVHLYIDVYPQQEIVNIGHILLHDEEKLPVDICTEH